MPSAGSKLARPALLSRTAYGNVAFDVDTDQHVALKQYADHGVSGLVNGSVAKLFIRHDVSLGHHLEKQAVGDGATASACETADVTGEFLDVGT